MISIPARAAVFVFVALSACAAVRTASVKSADGVRIVYDVRGAGKTALVFVHCWSCNRSFWREQADAFADRYQVVTLDLAGHGESGRDRKHWTVTGLAEDVRAVADALKLKRMILVGHSMGGPVSLEAARLMRGRVLGVIAADTLHNAEMRIPAPYAQSIADKLKADFAGTMDNFMGSMVANNPAVRQWVAAQAKAADPAVAVALMLDFANVDQTKLFRAAGVPIRAINARSQHGPQTTVEVNRKYADYQAAFLDGAGHFVQLERPKEFNELLAKFAAEVSK